MILQEKYNNIMIAIDEYRHRSAIKVMSPYFNQIEESFNCTEKQGWGFGGWALSKKSIRSFCTHVFKDKSVPNIIELGGGLSSLFWNNLQLKSGMDVKVTTLEHNPFWGSELKGLVGGSNVQIKVVGLKTISDVEKNDLFNFSENAHNLWLTMGKEIPEEDYEDTRIINAFYALTQSDLAELKPCDGLIVDGPHGNGRSIVFSLFYNLIKPDTIILIDDYNHHNYLNDLSRCFVYDVLDEENKSYKSYIIVKIRTSIPCGILIK